jgi:intracellular sulfur oxidation DsrE/DsrF family protein
MSRKSLIILVISLVSSFASFAQQGARTAALKANESKLIYPLYKGSVEMGVMPVENVQFPFVHKGTSKVVFDVSAATPDSARNTYNAGLLEAMRILNLHVAAGVPPEKIDAVVVFHGPAAASFFNDEVYNKRFKMNNPNGALIQELKAHGVKFVVCGQTLALRNLTIDAFPAGVQKAYSARTALSDLQQQGYAVYSLTE